MKTKATAPLVFGERALATVVAAMPKIAFDRSKRSHLYAVTLHASIVQLCGGCFAMAKSDYTAGIPVLLRSMFEAIIDLDNIARDTEYSYRMDAANLKQLLELLKESPTNPLLAGLSQKYDVDQLMAEWNSELHNLHACKHGKKDIRAKCADVGREDEYLTVYGLLCLDSHNNVAALMDRHIVGSTDEPLQVHAFGDENQSSLKLRTLWATEWMLQSAEFVHGAFGTGFSVAALQAQHHALRSSILSEQ